MKKKLGDFTLREIEMICRKHLTSDDEGLCIGCPFGTSDSRACLTLGNNTDEELEMEVEVNE